MTLATSTHSPGTDPPQSPEPRLGWPPRFWWLKRLGTAGLVLVAGLIGFHWWLDRHVEARLERIVDGWRADPEAPLPEMLLVTRGPPTGEDNAAFHYHRAITGLPNLTQKQRDEWYLAERQLFPVPPEKVDLLREIIAAVQPELDLARHARSLELVDWNLPAVDVNSIPNWNGVRALAERQQWAMFLAHHDGEVGRAVEYGGDMHRLGSASVSFGPSLIAGIVSGGVQYTAVHQLLLTAWHRPPGMSDEQERAAWRAAAPQVRETIALLLEEQSEYKLLVTSWKGERVVTHSYATASGLWNPGSSPAVLFEPIIQMDVARLLERQDRIIAAAEAGDPVPMLASSKNPAPRLTAAGTVASTLSSLAYGSMEHPTTALVQAIAGSRAAAVVLAAKLYHADHGRWPESLEAMVPEYLPHLPVDSFAPGGAPLRVRADTPVPIVYSIGANLTDDGGLTISNDGLRADGTDPMNRQTDPRWRRDLVFPLYLPPEAFENVENFNVWNWLISPEAERSRLEKLDVDAAESNRAREAWEEAERQREAAQRAEEEWREARQREGE